MIDSSPGRVEISEEVEASEDSGFLSDIADFFGGDGEEDHPSAYYTIRMPRTADLVIDAFSSGIYVSDLRADLTADTFSSDVSIESLRGQLDVETFSGNITAENVHGSVEMESHSGSAEITFDQLTGSSFESFSGDVTLHLPDDAHFDLIADLGMSGDFESDFSTDALNVDDEALRLTIGGGGPTIQFETFSGDLTLHRR